MAAKDVRNTRGIFNKKKVEVVVREESGLAAGEVLLLGVQFLLLLVGGELRHGQGMVGGTVGGWYRGRYGGRYDGGTVGGTVGGTSGGTLDATMSDTLGGTVGAAAVGTMGGTMVVRWMARWVVRTWRACSAASATARWSLSASIL